jgi:hydroxypyruvate isomerase
MPRFAANLTWMFHEHAFVDRFAAARDLGFEAVECQFPYEWEQGELSERLAASGLEQIMFNMPPGDADSGDYGLAGLPGRRGELQDSVGKALEYAAAMQCTMLHMLAGIVPPDQPRQKYLDAFIDNLGWAAAECARSGVTVLVEPINTFERPGYLISTTVEAQHAIAQVNTDNVAMQFDFHNVQLMEGNLTAILRASFPLIRHMQIAGIPGRTPPDKGELNTPYLFDCVDQLGYTGWIGCEFRCGEPTAGGLVWAKPFGIGKPAG